MLPARSEVPSPEQGGGRPYFIQPSQVRARAHGSLAPRGHHERNCVPLLEGGTTSRVYLDVISGNAFTLRILSAVVCCHADVSLIHVGSVGCSCGLVRTIVLSRLFPACSSKLSISGLNNGARIPGTAPWSLPDQTRRCLSGSAIPPRAPSWVLERLCDGNPSGIAQEMGFVRALLVLHQLELRNSCPAINTFLSFRLTEHETSSLDYAAPTVRYSTIGV